MARALDSRLKALDKAMTARARVLHLCPLHITPLECAYNLWWTGSAAEWEELEPLIYAMEPYQTRLQPSGQLCPRCRDHPQPLYCLLCNQEAAKPFWIPDEVMTPAQYARYLELSKRLEPKPPGTPHHLLVTDDIILKPPVFDKPSAPAPEPPSRPAMVAPIAAPVPVAPVPELAPVDDDEVDGELVQLVAELQRRLGK